MRPAYEIGRYYSVLCAPSTVFLRWVPLLGPLHEDAEIVNFQEQHWHIDWRFVSQREWNHYCSFTTPLAVPISEKNVDGPPCHRRLKCKREMPIFPGHGRVIWLKELEAAYQNDNLKPGLICPHRGIPLAGCPAKDGVVVCPGHGLAWNIETGKLVPR